MPTTLYLRATPSNSGEPVSLPSFGDYPSEKGTMSRVGLASTTRGSAAVSHAATASTGPLTLAFGGCLTPPLAAAVTISGTITFNFWGLESAMTTNAGFGQRVYRIPYDGSAPVLISSGARGTELGTSNAANNWTATPTSTALSKGDRLLIIPYTTDTGGTMGAGTVTLYTDGPTAAASGDTYVTFTETLSFFGSIAGSTLYLSDAAASAGINPGAGVEKDMWTSRGSGVVNRATNTAAGPTSPIQATNGAGQAALEWYSRPLQAVTLAVPMAVNIRALESNALANVGMIIELYKTATDGTSPVLIGKSRRHPVTGNDSELSTSSEIPGTLQYIGGPDVTLVDGERLKLVVLFDDTLFANMASGYTASVYFNASASGSGDSYIQVNQTLTEYVAGIALVGSSAGAATVGNANLTTSIRLVGSSAGVATPSGVLTTSIRLVGSSAGAATVPAANLTTQVALVGSSAGTATVPAANLTTAIALVGSSAGAATVSPAQFQANDVALVGSSAGVATASGVLTTSIALVASSAGVGTVPAANLTTAIALVGSSPGVAAVSPANLTTAIRLAGSSAGVASPAGVLTTSIRLAGTSAGVATTAGALTTAIALVGSSAGVATAVSQFASPEMTTTPVNGVATASGVLTTQIRFVGSSAGVGAVSPANLTTAIALVGTSAGVAALSAALTTEIRLVGGSAGVGVVAPADLTTAIRLVGSAAGVATAVGELTTPTVVLVGSAAGVSTALADLTTAITLIGLATGTSAAGPAVLGNITRAAILAEQAILAHGGDADAARAWLIATAADYRLGNMRRVNPILLRGKIRLHTEAALFIDPTVDSDVLDQLVRAYGLS